MGGGRYTIGRSCQPDSVALPTAGRTLPEVFSFSNDSLHSRNF